MAKKKALFFSRDSPKLEPCLLHTKVLMHNDALPPRFFATLHLSAPLECWWLAVGLRFYLLKVFRASGWGFKV